MKKLNGTSKDLLEENINNLKQLFPEAFTENKVDFEALKEVLGEYVEKDKERYAFTWAGKQQARREAQKVSTGTLRPCKEESVNFDTTENLYIEGDNLEVLKLLQKSYHNKVKMIYIDPPYNTGKDFVYKDNYHDNLKNYKEITGQIDSEGNRISTNSDSAGRYHSNWLNMMYPRLKLARNLLKDDGVIFISIDDNEVHNLRKVCDEIFGEENFVTEFPWQARQSIQNDTDISSSHEYILSYSKNRRQTNRRLKENNKEKWYKEKSFACYPLELEKDKFSNPDKDNRGLWKADPFDAPNIRPNLTYPILNPNNNNEYMPPKGRHWRTSEVEFKKLLLDNRIVFGKTGESKPQLKVFFEEKKDFGSVANTWLDGNKCGTATKGTKAIQKLFGSAPFETPKPIELSKHLMKLATKNNDIILDFFSGSSTTAHAVLDLNKEDGGNRKFIMVQLPEPTDEKSEAFKAGYKTIAEIGKERIRRVIDNLQLKIDNEKGKDEQMTIDSLFNNSQLSIMNSELDLGFKVLKLDSSNIKAWDSQPENLENQLFDIIENIKPDRKEEDILYEIMLKYGLELTVPIDNVELIIDNGKRKAKLFNVGMGALICCLDKDITLEIVEGIGKLKEELEPETCRVVLLDSGFKDDVVKTNAMQILKRYGVDEIRSI